MRNAILMLLLVIVSGSATAEWVQVAKTQTETVYTDPATMSDVKDSLNPRFLLANEDRYVEAWVLRDFKNAETKIGREGVPHEPYKSTKMSFVFACKTKRYMVYFGSIFLYSDNMGKGEEVDAVGVTSDWYPVSPKSNSGYENIWKIACK